MMNNRIAAMRAQCLATKPELLTDRVQLVTDSYRQTSGQPAVLQRALALKNIMEKMGLYIGEQELFVGNPSPAWIKGVGSDPGVG
jgi:formate C-acetyltransferase